LNATVKNTLLCKDRHVEKGLGDKIAFYWVGNDPKDKGEVTLYFLRAIAS
jgi:acyl-coenzyme A synthetase/AMP-(fatty) acid ligase